MAKTVFVSALMAVALVLAAVASAAAPSITLTDLSPTFGQATSFTTEIPKLKGNQYPMVDLACYQDVNGDNTVDTSLQGPDIVYSWLDRPDAIFSYSGQGQSSIWSNRDGGPATCRADLVAISWKGGAESSTLLASTGDYPVAG